MMGQSIASTFVDENGRVVEHRPWDPDPGVYLVGDASTWDGSKDGLPVIGFEEPGQYYRKGERYSYYYSNYQYLQHGYHTCDCHDELAEYEWLRSPPAQGVLYPDYTIESFVIPLGRLLNGIKYARILRLFLKHGSGKTASALAKTGIQFSEHALERMAERGITPKMVDAALRKGTKYFDPKNGAISHVL